ncbi:LacI family transcriptional regulator [Caldibacillus lycopersici]|uniref:LacI family transcriptional regulator n=1 Tax=Perspicuibacillus lycopersici TaxID=1325689 RepID=A0AAE3IR97_9BACI|nr:LacI family DNA-binding transcriptional regulator [Perspicuibacillus lycopersici]MCU9613130.1 LacI family transcriptional regulator [Perspicuibacillus lycopersici]
MKITIKDVARISGVSVGTVSKVINGKPVSEKIRSKVIETIHELNYKPNQHARSLITNKSYTIGLIVTNITNPFFGEIVSHIKEDLEQKGYNLLLGISRDQSSEEKVTIENFVSRHVDGLIIVPTRDGEHELEHIYKLRQQKIPFVFITSQYLGIRADCVMSDFTKGSYQLTSHLLDNENKEIYFLTDSKELLLSSKRIDGYRMAYMERGITYKENWIIETLPNFESAYKTTEGIINNQIPDAIMTINDVMAMGVIKCLKDNGIKVPEDVSVAGYDDLLFSSMFDPPLTTVKQPIEEMCKETVDILIKRLQGYDKEFNVHLYPSELIIRESTK